MIKSLNQLKSHLKAAHLPTSILVKDTKIVINYLDFLSEPYILDIYKGCETIHYGCYKTKREVFHKVEEIFSGFIFN